MLLVVDVGNTQTVIGIFQGHELIRSWRIHTEAGMTADEFHLVLSAMFRETNASEKGISRTAVSCVVPPLVDAIGTYCLNYLKHSPLWVTPDKVRMPILYDNPSEVGADRLVNAAAAYHKYPEALIIIDFGTATTFDVISGRGEYIGGAISPGIGIAAEALFSYASKLPRVEFLPPSSAIGRSTSDSMKSGIILGYTELVDGMVRRIKKELYPQEQRVIATGGMARAIRDLSSTIELVEPDLTLEGLRIICEQNS